MNLNKLRYGQENRRFWWDMDSGSKIWVEVKPVLRDYLAKKNLLWV